MAFLAASTMTSQLGLTSVLASSNLTNSALPVAVTTAAATTVAPAIASAQPFTPPPDPAQRPSAEDTPPIDEIFGDAANNGLGDIPVTELNNPDQTWPILIAAASFSVPLTRLALGVFRPLLPKSWKTADQSLAAEGALHSANHFVSRVANSTVGSIAAHARNLGAAIYVGHSLSHDALRLFPEQYWPELLIVFGIGTSLITRFSAWRRARKLKKAGVPAEEIAAMRQHALGFMPKRMPKPKQLQASSNTVTETATDIEAATVTTTDTEPPEGTA